LRILAPEATAAGAAAAASGAGEGVCASAPYGALAPSAIAIIVPSTDTVRRLRRRTARFARPASLRLA